MFNTCLFLWQRKGNHWRVFFFFCCVKREKWGCNDIERERERERRESTECKEKEQQAGRYDLLQGETQYREMSKHYLILYCVCERELKSKDGVFLFCFYLGILILKYIATAWVAVLHYAHLPLGVGACPRKVSQKRAFGIRVQENNLFFFFNSRCASSDQTTLANLG